MGLDNTPHPSVKRCAAKVNARYTHGRPEHELVPSRYALMVGKIDVMVRDGVLTPGHVGFEHPDWYSGFEHDPEEAARFRVRLLRELAANRESLVATHLSFPSVCHVAVDGDAFRWIPGPWEF